MFKEVVIKVKGKDVMGMLEQDSLEMPNVIKVGESLNVDGKEYKVLSHLLDSRDNILKIKLAVASSNKGVQDGKSNERSNKG